MTILQNSEKVNINYSNITETMNIRSLLSAAAVALILTGCGETRKAVGSISYFQDLEDNGTYIAQVEKGITVMPEDKLAIVVHSKDPQLANLFNLPIITRYLGAESGTYQQNQNVASYNVDSEGYIDFPVLGKVKVGGKTREEVAYHIKNELVDRNLVNDPVVTVEFMNMYISILGEVKTPGRYTFNQDRISILDAIGMAGDLTIYGRRDNVKVLREIDGVQRVFTVDLTKGEEIYSSPVFYLQQKDVIYVDPNAYKRRQSTVNANNVRSTSFWISIASVLTSMAVLIVNIVQK